MKLSYQARTGTGEVQTGTVDAQSREAAIDLLQRHNLIVLAVEEVKEGLTLKKEITFLTRIKTQDLVLFSRQLSVLFDAQVPLLQALRTLAEQTDNPKLREVILEIASDVDAGTSLSQALEKHPKLFSNFYVSVLRAGEASGRMQEVLSYLADHEEKNYDLNKKVIGALIYPAFIVFSIVVVGAIMMMFVVPQITTIFEETGADLPILTRIVIGTSNFLLTFWWLMVLLAIAGGVSGVRFLRTAEGRRAWDLVLLNIPIFKKLFQKIYLARFSENLGTLIKGGIPIIHALEITGDVVGNTVYKDTKGGGA
jgi:type IV pilus assembly protein PilC